MFFKYLGRELGKRRKQTALVASGLAIAIGLVVVVDAASVGVSNAQAGVLDSLYGIGTDISISKAGAPGEGNHQRFDVGSDDGDTTDGSRTFSRSRLELSPFQATLTSDEVASVSGTAGVKAYTGTLKLNSVTFNGELPDFMLNQQNNQQSGQPGQPDPNATTGTDSSAQPRPEPSGGFDGQGGSQFDITSFSVEGVDPGVSDLGPMSSVTLADGRLLTTEDTYSAILDADYATTSKLAVGDKVTLASKKFTVVGIVQSTSTGANSASNVYIPLATAQTLSENPDVVTNLYVAATSADQVEAVDAALTTALPDATVNSSSELASGVSGTLGSASSMIQNLGKWLSIIVLAAAFLIASLLTASGVNRRTREFGTLKAIGWRSRRIVGQVMGESFVTSLFGAVAGLGIGAAGVWAVNKYLPALTASVSSGTDLAGAGGMPGGGPGGGRFQELFANNSVDIALNATMSAQIVLTAIALAVLGGVIAGAYGGWRASRLSPAESLRSVA